MRPGERVPAAARALAALRVLAAQPGPVPAAVIARELNLPRSSTYQLLAAMAEQGFVTHLAEERRWALDVGAFEIGTAYLRHRPLERLARPLLRRVVDAVGEAAHLGVLHGADIMYLVKEQPGNQVALITDVGVRLPGALTASGRAILAYLPKAQVRALFPAADAFVDRTGRGPRTLAALRRELSEDRRRGWSVEDEYVLPGFASLAAAAFDHGGRPVASISVTFRRKRHPADTWPNLAAPIAQAAAALTGRLRGHPPA